MKHLLLITMLFVAWTGQAQFVPFGLSGTNRPVVAGGPNAWYDVETFANTDSNAAEAPTVMSWTTVTVAAGGTATKLRIYVGAGTGSEDVKMALYPSAGGAPISSGSTTVSAIGQYWEVSITPVTVTATTYKIAWEFQTGLMQSRYKNGSGSFDFQTQAYAGFAPNPLPATAGTFSRGYAVSIFVQ